MTKFLLCVGAEKAGTSWLYKYFEQHPDFHAVGKELNVIQRDDLVPTLNEISLPFQKDLTSYFEYFSKLNKLSGDFTHYEGSTENVFRLIKTGFSQQDIEVVPVYIMRDPISRAWSSFNMISQINVAPNTNISSADSFLLENYLSCKYKETVIALDSVFSKPIYLFYERMFDQNVINNLCDRLDICHHPAKVDTVYNRGMHMPINEQFKNKYGLSNKNKAAVEFISERFENVPWNIQDYKKN